MLKTSQNTSWSDLGDYIDLERYPINRLDSASGQSLIHDCHLMMAQDTICILPGFLRQPLTDALAEEISLLETEALKVDFMSTAYGWMNNAGFSSDHPRSQLFRRRCGVVGTERLDVDGLCMRLFQFDEITEFVRRLLGYDSLYRSACPNISVRLNSMQQEDEFGWHYDTNDGVVSFITQNADEGGVFEYAPLIRSEEDENYDGVNRIIEGIDQPQLADTPAGTFTLFLGRRSLHRVCKVGQTKKSRQSLLFSYDRKPGMVFPAEIRKRMSEPSSEPFLGALTPRAE